MSLYFPGCPTCRPIRRVSKGARWIGRPAARVMATASCGHLPSSTIIDVGGYRITTFKEPRSRPRHHPCTLPSLNWPVTSRWSTWRMERSLTIVTRITTTQVNIVIKEVDYSRCIIHHDWRSSFSSENQSCLLRNSEDKFDDV
jgi:hypothetical protein